jgi:hypothetical protein
MGAIQSIKTNNQQLGSNLEDMNQKRIAIEESIKQLNKTADRTPEPAKTQLKCTTCREFRVSPDESEALQPAIKAHLKVANLIAQFVTDAARLRLRDRITEYYSDGDIAPEINKFLEPTWCCVDGKCQFDTYPFKSHKIHIVVENNNIVEFWHQA